MYKQLAIGLITLGFAAGSANAMGATWYQDIRNTIPGTSAGALFVDGLGVDWTATVLVLDVSGSAGSIHNGAPDSARPQDAFWGFFPDLQWDTYVGIPGGVNDVGPLGAGDLGQPVLSMAGNTIAVTWGNTDTGDTGPTQIANITLSDNSQGTWQMLTSFADGTIVQSGGVLTDGFSAFLPIPEPGTLALLGVGGAVLMRRSRSV